MDDPQPDRLTLVLEDDLINKIHILLTSKDFFMVSIAVRECLHETRNEISTHHKMNSVYITFHCGRNEMNFISGVVRDKRPIK